MSALGQKQTLWGINVMSALPQWQQIAPRGRRLIFCLEIALYQVGNFQIVPFGSLAKAFRNAKLIVQLAVLAHLPLALKARDDEAGSSTMPRSMVFT